MQTQERAEKAEDTLATVQPGDVRKDLPWEISKMAVIGDRDSVLPFKAVGMKVVPVADAQEAARAFDSLVNSKYVIIFITERVAEGIQEKIERVALKTLPSVVLIPDNRGALGLATKKVRQTVSKAIGADIFQGGDK
ncbi:MAG: V-type ATP synthase subunit F [Candidatus Latescibacterota bacterium]|nr:MAG: V-type ATP synthase subunit F [Candidatus Latescibacterota bacterium]